MLWHKVIGSKSVVPTATHAYNTITGSGSNLTTYTFSSVSVGTAAAGRLVVAVVSYTALSETITSVVIGGVTATLNESAFGGSSSRMVIASAVLDTGTTATITVGFSSAPLRCTVATYSLYDLVSSTPVDTLAVGETTSGSTISGSIDHQAGGVVVGGTYINSATVTTAWTNLTEDAERVEESTRTTSVAADDFNTTGTTTITATFSSSLADNKALIACSWR